jgi:membrane associated rhomboid family serine protease
MHGDFMHLLFNMISLWFLGSILENLWGPQRFLKFYLICGLGAALLHLGIQYFQNAPIINSYNSLTIAEKQFYADKVKRLIDIPMVGASGAVSGCLAGLAYLMPNSQIFILPIPFPIKIKWYALLWFGKELISGLINSIGDNVAHFAHLGGGIVGFILVYFWNKSRKRFY